MPHSKANNDDIALIQCALGELTSSSALKNTAFPTLLQRMVTKELDSTSTELQSDLEREVKILYDENKSLKKKETTRSRIVNQLIRKLEKAKAKGRRMKRKNWF